MKKVSSAGPNVIFLMFYSTDTLYLLNDIQFSLRFVGGSTLKTFSHV